MELAPFSESFARLAAGRQLVSDGRRAEADVELRRAIELLEPMGARRHVGEAKALLSAAEPTAKQG